MSDSSNELKEVTSLELRTAIEDHEKWLGDDLTGQRMNLCGCNLHGVNFDGADLKGACLRGSNLKNASLYRANMEKTDLAYADLRHAELTKSDLSVTNAKSADFRVANATRADMYGGHFKNANFSYADLRHATFFRASLEGANLVSADLIGTSFSQADIRNTCIDPNNEANGKMDVLQNEDIPKNHVVWYRTRYCLYSEKADTGYIDDWVYMAPVFSTAFTECHPGLYVWPSIEEAKGWASEGQEIIAVKVDPAHVHKASGKWRTRWFKVLGTAMEDGAILHKEKDGTWTNRICGGSW